MNRHAQPAISTTALVLKQKAHNPDGLATFPPEYFALTMATGIVSLAVYYQGWEMIARVLFGLNIAAYLVLWVLTLLRFVRYRARLLDDLTHHFHSAAFLTIVAGTCVLGCQFAILTSWMPAAKMLWFVGIGFWVVLGYTFFVVVTVRNPKPSLAAGINGVWLLVVVAAESISALGTLVSPVLARPQLALFLSLITYLVGGMFYAFFITLILYRWMFFRMRPEKLTPDYWIDMGALAIATLAGAFLLLAADRWSLLQNLKPFLLGFTLLFWATATWWIPLLIIVEVWRHLRGHVRFIYSPDYWSLVFPLGMYSAATFMLIKVMGLTFLSPLAAASACVAAIVWGIVFLGMIRGLARRLWRQERPC
ncbi:MAG: tellurite resistance/C4-dicarboxylate transporter family protein [Limisphaerales bacterium]